jgi:hypothetical protein
VIVDIAVAVSLLLFGWWLAALGVRWVERVVQPDDPLVTPSAQERVARRRRARWRALPLFAAPWIFWIPMLLVVDRPGATMAFLLAFGLGAALVGAFHTTGWRAGGALVLFAGQSLVQLVLLLFFGGLAADSRLDPQTQAQRATVVELRRLGRAWWEWSLAAGAPEGALRETDAALLLADRAMGWPALRGLAERGPRLVEAGAYPELEPSELQERLSPLYLPPRTLPFVDGWGRPLELRGWLEPRDPTLPRFLVRSAGADGRFDAVYRAGPFAAERVSEDIVWADGAFLREPEPAWRPD